MKTRSLIGVMGALCAATFAWGQAVPSQIANPQLGSNSGGGKIGNSFQLQYQLDHKGYNQSQEAFIQFDLSVFPTGLTASGIQKATLVLYANNGGDPGNISICQVSQAWSASTLTGINAPPCSNTPMVTFPVTNAVLQQGGFVSVDITQIVQNSLQSGNHGIALIPLPPVSGNDGVNVQFGNLQSNGNNGYPPMLDLVLSGGSGGTSSQGAQGQQGQQGQQGATGATGPAGPAGAKGATGANGSTGAAGSAGATGAAGPAGATGAAGAPGATGPSGAQGLQGVPGALGPTGVQGSTGAQGSTGTAGPTGAAGTPGATGPAGAPGTPGLSGTNGLAGPTGPMGPAGLAGGALQVYTATLSEAQVQALGTVPIEVIPSAGPGKIILPMAMAMYVPGPSGYSADLAFSMAGQDLYDWGSALAPNSNSYISPSVNGNFISTQGGIFGINGDWTGKPLTVSANGLSGNGNGIVITIWYLVWGTA